MTEIRFPRAGEFAARALLVAEHLDLRNWGSGNVLATTPLTVLVGGGVAVLFRYGVVVLFDVPPAEEAGFIAQLAERAHNPYERPETEQIAVRVDAESRGEIKGNTLTVRAADIWHVQVIADVLSKSVLLALYESKLASDFDRIEPVALGLQRTGRVPGRPRELMQHIGAMLLSEHRMVGRAEIADKPELLWEHPELEGLYIRLEDEFELKERHAALEQKLNLISRTAESLLQILHNRHSLRVEWYIVALILAEILLTLYELFVRGH